jgi:hygromycin-B 7''-O-kinase
MPPIDLTQRACLILQRLGLPDSPIEPVESYSNAVWLTRDHVVHYHVIGPSGRLAHEARVAARLPPEARYPEVLAVGRDGDHDWLVTRRVAGHPLSAVWPWLSRHERRHAIHQVAAALRAVHRSPATDLVPPCLQGGVPVLSRQALAARLTAWGGRGWFDGLFAADGPPASMAHGDFGFNQALWHQGHITALLDLEMSHAEAPDWDLAPFLEFCQDPVRAVPEHLEAVSKAEDYREAPGWLREAYPEMFAYPRLRDRLALYALVFRFAELADQPSRYEEILAAAFDQADALAELLP